jgi:Zn finger protein HypA/HybF involved in hydrogenase expression
MHESHLLENIFRYLDKEEEQSCRRIKKVYISLSEFGALTPEHFQQHYRVQSQGTRWAGLKIQIKRVPFGPELEITRLDFE